MLLTLFLVLTTTLSACGGAATSTTAPAAPLASAAASIGTPAAGGESGGTLDGAFDVDPGGSPQGFNPMIQGAGFLWLEKYFSKLVVYDFGFTKIQGELADAWEIAPDAQTFTFKPRKGVT
jgi:peptide/nickel transport system substrate-binding protein